MSKSAKYAFYSLAVLLSVCLVACKKQEAQPQNQQAATLPNSPAQTTQASVAAEEEYFGGTFLPDEDYIKTKAEFVKWQSDYEGDPLGFKAIEEFPKKFHAYLFRDPLYGYYDFVTPNRLTIIIKSINDDKTFKAVSVAAGNEREITGTWELKGDETHFTGQEPGDDKNDGKFDMILADDELTLSGTWTPFDKKAKAKDFTLMAFNPLHDPKDGQLEDQEGFMDFGSSGFEKNPSLDVLKTTDVENLTQPQIRIIRNLIFARHGYSFRNKDLRLIFESYPWYMPVTNNVKDQITDVEKANLALLTRYEKYAEQHYDEYGR